MDRASLDIPRAGSSIFVQWQIPENNKRKTTFQVFKAYVLSITSDVSEDTEVLANGAITYVETEEYNAVTHGVQFLTFRRVRTTSCIDGEFDATPCPWETSEGAFDDEEFSDEDATCLVPHEVIYVANSMGSWRTDMTNQLALTQVEIEKLKNQLKSLASNILNPTTGVLDAKCHEVRMYATANLFREVQKPVSGRVRRLSKSNSIQDEDAMAVGPIVTSFLKSKSDCSFQTFYKWFLEIESSVGQHPLHSPEYYPSRPSPFFCDPLHNKYTIVFPTITSICIALGIKNEDARKELLWTIRNETARVAGSFVYKSEDSPAFLVLGTSSIPHSSLMLPDSHESSETPHSLTVLHIPSLSMDEDLLKLEESFCIQVRKTPRIHQKEIKAEPDIRKSILLTWSPKKSLKRRFQEMISNSDTLGEITVSLPTLSTVDKSLVDNLTDIVDPATLKQIITF